MKKIFTLVFMAACTLCSAQIPMVNPNPRIISVTGSAEMEIIPDQIFVQVDPKEYKKKGENKVSLETIKSNFLAACGKAGIADSLISISAYEGYNYDYWHWRRRKKDQEMYSAIYYQIRSKDSKTMDMLIDNLDDDATSNFMIVCTSHSNIQQYHRQLKILAVKTAKEKGIYVTEAINEKLGEAITITEPDDNSIYISSGRFSNVLFDKNKSLSNSTNAEPAVDFKKIKLKYDVKIIFAIK